MSDNIDIYKTNTFKFFASRTKDRLAYLIAYHIIYVDLELFDEMERILGLENEKS